MKIEKRRPQGGLVKVTIDFGSGSRAFARFVKLHCLMPAVKQVLRDSGRNDQSRLLVDWMRSFDYRIDELPNTWVMELNGEQWQALSRGLRHQGPKGRSMMTWVARHAVKEYPPGGMVYSPTYSPPSL